MRTPLRVIPAAPKASQWQPWEGGRCRTVDGVTTYYLRRRLGTGVRVEFALGTDLNRARLELTRFNDDPAGYRPPKERAAEVIKAKDATTTGAVRLDFETLEEFFDYCAGLVDKRLMSDNHYRGTLKAYLKQWAKVLQERDLHTVTLDDLQAALKRWQTAKHKRVVALKSFTKWARKVKDAPKLRRQADPTLDLATPKISRRKTKEKGYPPALVEKLYRALADQTARDIIRLRSCANGVHQTEIERIAHGEEAEVTRVDDPSGIAGVLEFWQDKKQDWHRVSVDAATLAAAERIQLRGSVLSAWGLRLQINQAVIQWHGCGGVVHEWKRKDRPGEVMRRLVPCPGCTKIMPSKLRHTFGTLAHTVGQEIFPKNQKGIPLARVSRAMGHTNENTTSGHYIGDHVPPMYKVPLKLFHPEDPKP